MKYIIVLLGFILLSFAATAQGIIGDWYGALELPGVKLRLVIHISAHDNAYKASLDSPDQGATGMPASVVRYDAPKLEIIFPSIGAEYRAVYEEEKLKGTFIQMGQSIVLNMNRQQIKRERPQEPRPPYPYVCEEVEFRNPKAGISLAGTLTLPEKEGVFPAVVLITGSGPQNRDEELMGHKPFLVLADYLTRQGIAVLRFDDRGVGRSGGVYALATTLDFAGDVAAAVNYLRTRKEIDPKGIGLVGHSEGGMIAPMIAAEDKEIAFAVLLAGVGVPAKELLLQQSEDILKAGNSLQEVIAANAAFNRKAYRVLERPETQARKVLDSMLRADLPVLTKGQTLTQVQQEQFVQQQLATLMSPWFRKFITLKPEDYLRHVHCPVLALNGKKDLQVNACQNLTAIYDALKKSGNQKVDTLYLPGLNHLFQRCNTGLPTEYAFLEETFSPEALKMIAEWIRKEVRGTSD